MAKSNPHHLPALTHLSPPPHEDTQATIACEMAYHGSCAGWRTGLNEDVTDIELCECWCHHRPKPLRILTTAASDDATITHMAVGGFVFVKDESTGKFRMMQDSDYLEDSDAWPNETPEPTAEEYFETGEIGEPLSEGVEITHQCPAGDDTITPCCGVHVLELPWTDRMTVDPELVNCPGEPPRDEDQLGTWNKEEQRYEL